MFAPNHCLHWDNGIILMAIPLSWRWKLAVAAAADDVFGNKLNGFFSSVVANAFPLAREGDHAHERHGRHGEQRAKRDERDDDERRVSHDGRV